MYLRVCFHILWRFLTELAQLLRIRDSPLQITILCQKLIEVGAYEISLSLFISRHIFLQFGKQLFVTLISPTNHIRQEMEQEPKFRARIRFYKHHLSCIFLYSIFLLCPLIQLHFRWKLKQPIHIKQAYDIIILLVQIGFYQFQNMIDVTVLWKVRRNLKRITTRNPQRIKIEPFCLSFTYNCDTLCYCSPHIISRLGQCTDCQGTAILLIFPACKHYTGKDSCAIPN